MFDRRQFLICSGLLASSLLRAEEGDASSRLRGMLIGSLIGDALGGPFEFATRSKVESIIPEQQPWSPSQPLDEAALHQLAQSLTMHGYAQLRPDAAPYGPWKADAPVGTITDDSRHKMILLRAMRQACAAGARKLTIEDLARELIEFRPRRDEPPDPQVADLLAEGLREYRYAAHWVLGHRDPRVALPLERLWSGIANCSGQMMLIPLAGLFPGRAEQAYRVAYELDFIDAPLARDFAAALVAGLAASLDPKLDHAAASRRWDVMFDAMRHTDPYRMADVPFAGRPLHKWLDLTDRLVELSEGRPDRAYELLESDGHPIYYWDAHFTLLVPITLLKLCRYNPLAAMHVTLNFGHDTDSYLQVLCAMVGAVHGDRIFPRAMSQAVLTRLHADYAESIDQWQQTISAAAAIYSQPRERQIDDQY